NRSIDDIIVSIKQIGQALDREKESKHLIAEMVQKQQDLEKLLNGMKYRPRVLVVHRHMGGTPLAAGTGTAANNIIALSGGVNVVTEFANYKPLTPEAAAVFRPELIIIAAPPDDAIKDESKLATHPVFDQTPAGENGHIYVMDALEVLGFGPRIIDTAVKLNQLYLNL
ncbi:MAG: ABC transporter substrate-binding protein, partial [Alphaproteobacteria bacterium]|nr:ABC transporter substrate-binding protein [Alphaproteobacteria bacterium]